MKEKLLRNKKYIISVTGILKYTSALNYLIEGMFALDCFSQSSHCPKKVKVKTDSLPSMCTVVNMLFRIK